jgi:hypothetical protein
MKINSMQRMLGTLMAAAIVGSSAIIVPVVSAQNAPGHYSDDAIVRDLKAGKLTVREAQMLRARRDRAAAPVPPPPLCRRRVRCMWPRSRRTRIIRRIQPDRINRPKRRFVI